MSRIAYITSLLEDLNKYTPQNNQRNATAATLDPKALAIDLATTTLTDIADSDFDYVISLLFRRESSILNFLRVNVYTKDPVVKAAQNTLLDFLVSLFHKAKSTMKPYLRSIEQTCIALACDGSTTVRVKALPVLVELLKDSAQRDSSLMDIKELYERFSYEFRRPITAVPNTVKGALLELLGTIAKYHTDKVDLIQAKLLARNCINILSYELHDKPEGADNNIVAGALNGISCLLSNNKYDINQLSLDVKTVYKSLTTVFIIPDDLTRYAAPIAGLGLYIEHASLFRPYLVQDYTEIYASLQNLCGHQNRDISKLGYRALECSFKEIGAASSQNTGIQEQSMFKFYMEIFNIGLQQDYADLDFQLLSISVRGIGYFAKAAGKFLEPFEVEVLQEQLVNKGIWLCSGINSGKEKRIDSLPSFIQAYTQIIRYFDSVQPALMAILIKMTDLFVKLYGQVSAFNRQPGILTIQRLIKTLYMKGEGMLRQYVSPFFYNSLVSTCDSSDTNYNIIAEDDISNYKELVHFWTCILNNRYFTSSDSTPNHDHDDNNNSTGDADTCNQQILSILYDEFMSSVLHMVKALDLNVEAATDEEEEEEAGNAANGLSPNLVPVNQKDFILYQNLVGFWCTILPRLDNQRLPEWIGITGSSLIHSSLENPLVSGFYRMLATILTITRQTQLFKGCKESHTSLNPHQRKKSTVEEAYGMMYDYIHQVWHRMKQFKDEILVSCLRLVLVCPLEFFDVGKLGPPLQMAVRYGLSYYPMATIALDTLESLVGVDSPARKTIEDDPAFLQSILPLFNEYLMMDVIFEDDHKHHNIPPKRFKLETRNTRLRDTIHRKATDDELGILEDEDLSTSLHDVQLRIMRFLGRLGGANKFMVTSTTDGVATNNDTETGRHQQHELLSWDPDRQLSIHVPFPNAGIQLPMDELLPYICELAESSPDRKVKVASCEFLHGLILVMIGNSAFQARDQRGPVASRYHQLYKHIFPILLRLAIDLDQVTREMFQALMAQLIHWLTNNAQYENPETIILLQTCLDASCSTNAAQRDYGATCIHEFVKWSIKQTSAQAVKGPMNIKSLLKRLYHLATHPSPAKRLGASMVFNHIYRLFREEPPLVDEYTLELLYYFMFSMRLAEGDHPSLGTQQKANESISHLKRIIRVKSAIFLDPSPNRRSFPGTDRADLASVVEWCFQETGRTEHEYAKACMEFFSEFTLVLPGIEDAKDWLEKKSMNNPGYLVNIYSISAAISPLSNVNLTLEWMKQLSCALDGYVWLLERKILSLFNCAVLQRNENGISLVDACVHLVKSQLGTSETIDTDLTISDKLKIQSVAAYDCYRVVCLVNGLIDNLPPTKNDDLRSVIKLVDDTGLLSLREFSAMVASMLLLPHQTADAVKAGETSLSSWINATKVRSAASHLLALVHTHWDSTLLPTFCSAISEILSSMNFNSFSLNAHSASLQDMLETIQGVRRLQEMDLLDMVCSHWYKIDPTGGPPSSDAFCTSLFDTFLRLQNVDNPALIELLGNMIKLAFGQPHFADKHGPELLGYVKANDMNLESRYLTIYQRYSPYINSCIALNFQQFAPYLVKNLGNGYIKQIIMGLLNHLRLGKNTDKQETKHFTHHLISTPLFLDEIYCHWNTPEDYTTLVDVIKGIFGANPTIFVQAKSTPVYDTLVDIMERLLTGPYPLSSKRDSFDLLPFFLQVDGPHIDRISGAIKTVVNNELPVSFSDLTPGSTIYNDSLQALKSLLNIMSTFHSVVIFNNLLPTFMQDNGKVYQETITPSVSLFANGLGLPSFMKVAQTCFDYFKNVDLYSGHRKKAVDLVASILFLIPRDYVIAFYEANIVYIMGVIKREELRRGSDDEMILDLKEKACCFKLMQISFFICNCYVLYELLPVKQVHSPQSKISVLWEQVENKPGQGRKMTIDLVSQAHQAKSKKHFSESKSLTQARLDYQQAAYNAAAASILRTQKSEKFFVGFLFQEKPSEPLWANIVDTSVNLDLEVELDQPLLKSRLEQFGSNSAMDSKAMRSSLTPAFMASVGPIGSSLSQPSLSEIALDALGQKETPSQQTSTNDQEDTDMDDIDSEVGTTMRGSTEIELDQLNTNPCMKFLGTIVQRLHTSITPPDENSVNMPMWMTELHRAFISPGKLLLETDAPLVQKLFLAKVIINSPEVFQHYAQFWIRPLIQLAVRGKEYGQPINYFVQDLCVLIITWGKITSLDNNQSDRSLLYKFVSYLISNSYHENSGVLRNNIQILKSTFENWRNLIVVPTKAIYQQLSSMDTKSTKNRLGIQIAGVVLANGLELYYDGPEVDLDGLTEAGFYQGLFGNFKNHYVEVAASSAEVIAWSLTLMKKQQRADELPPEIEKHLSSIMSKYNMDSKKEAQVFLALVHRIHLHDDELCRPFLPKIFHILPHLVETPLVHAIEIITGYANRSPDDVFQELKGKGLLKILNHRNDASQVAILKLLKTITPAIKLEQANYFFNELVGTFHGHNNEDCRNHYYGLLEALYDKFSGSESLGNEIKVQLLCGLVDGSEYIRNNIHLYLERKLGLTNDIYERTKLILKDMFMPPVENVYVFYATQMLLKATTGSYEYDKPVFDSPLPNAHFDDHIQHLNTSWRRNLSMTPLFVASQNHQHQESNEYLDNQLRQTQQTLEFSQTQATGGRSLMSTFAGPPSSQSLAATSPSQNDQEKETRQDQYANLRRRYVRSDPGKTSSFFIHRQDKLKRNLQKYMALQKQQREKKVVMHRRYRIGKGDPRRSELPDIQIKYSELMETLQALGRNDQNVARILFTQLVAAIGRNAEVLASKEDYKSDLITTIKTNLDTSTLFSPPAVGSFLRIYFELNGQALDSDLIKVVSQRSFNHHLGIAVLERQIGSESYTSERPSKRTRYNETSHKLHASSKEWIDLATLYQNIDEPEIFQSLYRTHVATKDLPKSAVDARIRGDIALSCNLLQESMANHHDDTDPYEYDLWAKEGLRCFEQLTQWDDVSFHVTNDLDGDYERLWNKEYQIPYLHYFLRSNIKLRKGILDDDNNLVEWTAANPNPIFSFLRQSMQSKDKLDYLIEHHAAEITLAALYTNDIDRGRHYIRQSYEYLHSTWVNLHPLSKSSRMQRLAMLQKNVELEDFLDVIAEVNRNNISDCAIEHYIHSLQCRFPDSKLDGMDLWDDVIDSRLVFLDILSETLKRDQRHGNLDTLFNNSRKQFLMEMVSASRQQNNFNVAIDRWQKLLHLGNVEVYQRNYAFINIELQRCLVSDDFGKQSKLMARTLGSVFNYKLPDPAKIVDNDFAINFHMTAGKVIETARIQLQANPSTYHDYLSSKSVAKHFGARRFADMNDFITQLTFEGHNQLLTAHTLTTDKSSPLEAECAWRFGDYCDNALRANEDSPDHPPISINSIEYSKTVVNCFFRAIHLGQKQAAERFPRLLELIERYPTAGDDFKSNAEKSSVTWHYIRWIPQMVAILDKPIAKYVFPMVLKLAEEYPTALYYPFQLSNEHYECYKELLDPLNLEAIGKIKSKIRSPLLETFTSELRRLTNPEHIVKDFIDFIMSVGQKVDVNSTFLEESYQQFCNLVLDPTNSRLGTIPKAFAVKHASQLREIFGKNGSKIKTMSDKQQARLLKYYQTSIQNQKLPGTPDLLKSYSPWLSNFQSTNFKEQIEIPGQYHGRSRPDPESHVKIASFDDRVLVMGSLRKPKRLRINGTDGNESLFLVKGGEDLRLDQRIQQLFSVMNELIRKEPFCAKHDVHLTTYNVIPMATNIGMIEWVQDTKPLRNCIEEQLNNKGLLVRIQENYRLFVAKFKGDAMGYHNLFKAPRETVVNSFLQHAGSFQGNILKQYLIQLAASPEAFIFLRNNFAYSLGAISIVGYLLGIGDRHLENIMVDKKRGTLLAIDFGHAFGSATELLPVPEMTPFRLTRQLVGALEPLGVKGILEVIMVHTLEAVQREKQVILNVMDVFVKEPLLDWKKVAAKRAKAQKRGDSSVEGKSSNSSDFLAGSSSSTDTNAEYEWYPQQKLEVARKKLDGVNPSVIMLEELERGHSGKSYLKGLQKVVRGEKETNMRATTGDRCQNTLEQVQCLIDLATDPNILGRTWAGWQSYL